MVQLTYHQLSQWTVWKLPNALLISRADYDCLRNKGYAQPNTLLQLFPTHQTPRKKTALIIHMNTTRCNPIIRFYPNHWTRPLTFQWRNFGVGRNVVRSTSSLHEQIVPLRKELKEEAKRRRIESKIAPAHSKDDVKLANWELTVGIEIHAELNTSRKLFSDAFTSTSGEPNSNIALFDLAYPGSQPHFQAATLIPALRAALALNCKIERKSSFDRKHYFYQDQPAGYQITQYYGRF